MKKIKNFMVGIALAIMLISFIPVAKTVFSEFSSEALTLTASALSENGFNYKVENEEVTINSYQGSDKEIVIPSTVKGYPVTSIEANAFISESCTSIYIPASVKNIKSPLAYNCRELTTITVDEENSFYSSEDGILFNKDKTELIQFAPGRETTDYQIPGSVTKIGDYAFAQCKNLVSVTIPNGVTSIGEGAFSSCLNLKTITIPDSIVQIGNKAFETTAWLTKQAKGIVYAGKVLYQCNHASFDNGEKDVIVKDGTASITESAFSNCTHLQSVTIPKSVKYIGESAFYNTKLTAVYITDLEAWCNIEFASSNANPLSVAGNLYINGVLESEVTIPESITKIRYASFYGCKSVEKFIVPKGVKLADTKNLNYTVIKLKAGTNYKYAVKAYAKSDDVLYWNAAFAELSTATKPDAPTLKAAAGSKKASLSWNKVSGAAGYEIYMAAPGGKYEKIATVNSGTVKYTKSSLKSGATYSFKIRAYKAVGKTNIYSAYSSVQKVKIK